MKLSTESRPLLEWLDGSFCASPPVAGATLNMTVAGGVVSVAIFGLVNHDLSGFPVSG